jgi:hypothetical protein
MQIIPAIHGANHNAASDGNQDRPVCGNAIVDDTVRQTTADSAYRSRRIRTAVNAPPSDNRAYTTNRTCCLA